MNPKDMAKKIVALCPDSNAMNKVLAESLAKKKMGVQITSNKHPSSESRDHSRKSPSR